MIFVNTTPEKWVKRYKLPLSDKCEKCSAVVMGKPARTNDCAWMLFNCPCGQPEWAIATPATEAARAFWANVVGTL